MIPLARVHSYRFRVRIAVKVSALPGSHRDTCTTLLGECFANVSRMLMNDEFAKKGKLSVAGLIFFAPPADRDTKESICPFGILIVAVALSASLSAQTTAQNAAQTTTQTAEAPAQGQAAAKSIQTAPPIPWLDPSLADASDRAKDACQQQYRFMSVPRVHRQSVTDSVLPARIPRAAINRLAFGRR